MANRTTPFTILRRTTQKLSDLSRYLTGSALETSAASASSAAAFNLVPIPKRRSREPNRPVWSPQLPSTSSCTFSASRRHRSLTSMKTYYAFGARSHSACFPSRSYSSYDLNCMSKSYNASARYPFKTDYNNDISYSARLNTATLNRSVNEANELIAKYCRRPATLSSSSTLSRSSGYCSTESYSTKITAPRKRAEQSEFKLPRVPTISELRETLAEIRHRQPSQSPEESKQLDTSQLLTLDISLKEDTSASVELLDLKKKNEMLEEEIARLKLVIKDKERSEHELRRKLLETEAEAKVWRKKCEHLQPRMIDPDEPSYNYELFEKLDHATEKLANLNVANDLRMLQSEMESAMQCLSPP